MGSAYLSMTQGAAVADMTFALTNSTGPSDIVIGDKLLVHVGTAITEATNYFNGPYRFAGASTYATGAVYPSVTLTDPYSRTLTSGNVIPVMWRVLKADNRISSEARSILTVGAFIV